MPFFFSALIDLDGRRHRVGGSRGALVRGERSVRGYCRKVVR